jgi:hypothetical protein
VLVNLYQLERGLDAEQNTHLTLHQKALEQGVTHIMEHYDETVPSENFSKFYRIEKANAN